MKRIKEDAASSHEVRDFSPELSGFFPFEDGRRGLYLYNCN